MLRITRTRHRESDPATVLKLEGMLARAWVPVFEAECASLPGDRPILLDFRSVTYVDGAGAEAVRRLQDRGFSIINCSGIIEGLLENA